MCCSLVIYLGQSNPSSVCLPLQECLFVTLDLALGGGHVTIINLMVLPRDLYLHLFVKVQESVRLRYL